MYLNYAELPFNKDGQPECPELVLRTLGGEVICPISGAYNIEFDINFSEPSEIEFDVSAVLDNSIINPVYDEVQGWREVWTEHYGVYVIQKPKIESDGISDVKHVTGYSVEKTLEAKKFWLEEGTYKFWDVANPDDTILGRILEVAVGWSAGTIASGVANTYRTFDEYDEDLLSFVYNTAPEKYRCVFVFDPYNKTIDVWDADEEYSCLPIYLDFDNLLESVEVEELSDELVTAISPYGADDLNIRAVNPLGTNWIYDLSYFVSTGDISGELAAKYNEWQQAVVNASVEYEAISALRASCTSKLVAAEAVLTELINELTTLTIQQSAAISAGSSKVIALATITAEIEAKNEEITTQEGVIAEIEAEESEYTAALSGIVSELSIENYFGDDYVKLNPYILEMYLTEETFVATDVDTSVSGITHSLAGATISISDSSITHVEMSDYNKDVYSLAGGTFSVSVDDSSDSSSIAGDVVRGTIDIDSNGNCVMSLYAGSFSAYGEATASSGLITISATLSSSISGDIEPLTENEVTLDKGTTLSFDAGSGSVYITADINEYQQYAVEKELYDYAVDVLSDYATPTYEFSVSSANFLFSKEFEPFRNRLELGKGVYFKLNTGEIITPYIIELKFSFEDTSDFELTFSSRFKRHDNVNTLKDIIESTYSTTRSIDASAYIYNKTAAQATLVSSFMKSSLDFATNTILSADNQSIVIDAAGISVRETDSDGNPNQYQLRITNGMIAMTDDYWATSSLAIGRFYVNGIEYYGINTEILAGSLVMGEKLCINCVDDSTGEVVLSLDASGLTVTNGVNSFVLNPNADYLEGLLVISNGTEDLLWLDSNGDLNIRAKGTEIDLSENSYIVTITETLGDENSGLIYNVSKLQQTVEGFEQTVLDAENGFESLIQQFASSISLSVKNNNGSAVITLTASDDSGTVITSVADTIEFNGYVLFSDIDGSNDQTVINGSLITTGTIQAERINLTGSITWSDFGDGLQDMYEEVDESLQNAIDSLASLNKQVDSLGNEVDEYGYTIEAWTYEGTTTINGAMIATGTVIASTLCGGTINLLYSKGASRSGYITTTDATYSNTALAIYSVGGMRISASGGAMYLNDGDSDYIQMNDGEVAIRATDHVQVQADLYPYGSGRYDLGSSSQYWGDIYASSSEINTSDRNKKNSIEYNIDSRYDELWERLKPCTGKYNNSKSDRVHMFLIAQDIEDSMAEVGLASTEFAAFIKSPVYDDEGALTEYSYGLRYSEFIPLCIHRIQLLEERIKSLEAKI